MTATSKDPAILLHPSQSILAQQISHRVAPATDDRTLREIFIPEPLPGRSSSFAPMDYGSFGLLALSIALLSFSLKFPSAWWRRQLPFPPGPSPHPIIGNFRDIPTKLPWLTYTKWGIQYGSDIVHASALGQHIIVINSVKTAVEIFEQRAHIYSGRPVLTMVELLAAAIIMATVYGYEVQPTNDHFVGLAQDAGKRFSDSFFPGAVAVNTFPILRYLPSWMPGAGFQRFAAECRQLIKEMREGPFDFVKQNMRDGTDSTSVVARLIESNRYDEDAIKDVAGTAYAGGADSTVSCLASFFLAMALYPDIQKKAQTEIDTVIGTDRLPEFEDRPSLPFVEALYRELMRWKPVTPLGLARASTADDVYNGYFISKGTTVISNIWAMTRDESIYPEPERSNNSSQNLDSVGAYVLVVTMRTRHSGQQLSLFYQRSLSQRQRMTLGRRLRLTLIHIQTAWSGVWEWFYPISKFTGINSHPQPFACSIIPRSETAKSLVRATMETHGF
ncbi:hypothetical protein MSAN_00341500 [Mycena sanguinolenta]|uniref:Cytochrome P450 n=1 Tax=Mycena sanguinolenta TaxID=230812 RepID=A0A8H6ZC56_9AGAR|nr:hypothetical protein MSAN_00341500 [Mycena sanguinolenta]